MTAERRRAGASRARETFVIHGPDEFEEIFEIAEPEKAFTLYSRAKLKRVAGAK